MKKPLAALIIAKMKDKKSSDMEMPESESESDDSEDEGYKVAAEEILMSIKDNDAEGLAEALKNFVDQC